MTHNHDDYEERIKFARQLVHERIKLSAEPDITPLAYDPESAFKYNNFVYRISLNSPVKREHIVKDESDKAGCVEIPIGAQEFILRLANPRSEGMHPAGRTENEVAMLSLASQALSFIQPSIVPSIYGWGSIATNHQFGWILQQFMPGTILTELLGSMNTEQKRTTLAQTARILKGFHDFRLPESIKDFGGVTFDEHGQIVSGVMPTVGEGPWPSYERSFIARLELALKKADKSKYIKGWRTHGIRERLDGLVKNNISSQLAGLTSQDIKSIIHADFQPPNILIDPLTFQITGLIDYDFSCIQHPSYEFFRSFNDIGEPFRGWHHQESSEDAQLRHAKLHGFPSPLPAPAEKGVDWECAKLWEDELEKLDVQRPRTMEGIAKVADVDEILGAILPWRLHNDDALRIQSEKVILRFREECEKKLLALLDHIESS